MTYTPLPHPSSGWVGLCGAGLHTHSVKVDPDKGRMGTRTRVPNEGACHLQRSEWTRTRVSRGPGQGSPTRVHVTRSEWTRTRVSRGPGQGSPTRVHVTCSGQSGPGQGSDGDLDKGQSGTWSGVPDEGACHSVRVDPDKGQSGTWSGVPDEGACRLPDRGEWPL